MAKHGILLRRTLIALLGVYLFVYPWSILLVSLDRVPVWGTWMGGALLIIQGTLMGGWLIANYGKHGLLASLLILLSTWLIEHIGTTTGFPFGAYSYTDVLQPKIIGVVPLAIPFAWLLVVPSALGITEYLMRQRDNTQTLANPDAQSSRMLIKILAAASSAVLLDITIEPVSVHINDYWVWDVSGSYYGVPISNFVAWWLTSFLLIALLLLLQQAARTSAGFSDGASQAQANGAGQQNVFPPIPLFAWLPSLLYVLNLTMFVVVNMAHAQLFPAIIGGVLMSYLALHRFKPAFLQRLPVPRRRKTLIVKDEG